MNNLRIPIEKQELLSLCNSVRELVQKGDIAGGAHLAIEAMGAHPHAPEPHNLLGVLLEKQGDHPAAMKHFRAAWALDPTYVPARQNLESYGTFFSTGNCAYGDSTPLKENQADGQFRTMRTTNAASLKKLEQI